MPSRLPALLVLLPAAACARTAPPAPPREFGVHVESARADSAPVRFRMSVQGALELGIRSLRVAEQPDKSLLIATPADLVVNKGTGSALIVAAGAGDSIRVTALDSSDAVRATVAAHAVRVERTDTTRHVTAAAVSNPTP
jgi:hypothetical protein